MLTTEETETIKSTLGRVPNVTETHVFDAMWSEHCSYKSSKYWLKQLYTEGKHVISGPGENAGVIDIGDGDKLVQPLPPAASRSVAVVRAQPERST